jgi:hypothetical protein
MMGVAVKQSHTKSHRPLSGPPPRSGGGGPAKLVEGATTNTGVSCRPLHRLRRSPSPVSRWRSNERPVVQLETVQ